MIDNAVTIKKIDNEIYKYTFTVFSKRNSYILTPRTPPTIGPKTGIHE